MCGIAGAWQPAGCGETGWLTAMLDRLVHRGPDEAGQFVQGPVALGHRRLSIIDLATGRQPLAGEDGAIVLVMNGEIYNYRELRVATQARGHRYRTHSDAEVLVHLYEDEGIAALQRLNGMFACALWDGRRERLYLIRDRAGKKPLYYAAISDGLVFASEMKALLTHPDVERAIDPQALAAFVTHGFVPSPETVMRQVKKVPGGAYLEVDRHGHRLVSYWQLPESSTMQITASAAVEEFRQRLTQAALRRLVADVPVGVLLSGGLDSSGIVAALTRAGVTGLKTFSLGFAERSFDERAYAAAVARLCGTTHQSWMATADDVASLAPRLGALVDEPLADPSLIPTHLLARWTRQQVTVALGGDGGDELLGGYPTYPAHRWAERYRRWPASWQRGIAGWVERWPVSSRYMSMEFRAKRFVAGAAESTAALRHARWMDLTAPSAARQLLTPDWARAVEVASIDALYPSRWRGNDAVDAAMRCDLALYLQELVLAKVDRASMAVALEVRAPFLDVELMEWLARLPVALKVRGGTGKWLLREALRGWLPASIAQRGKQGFALPVAAWLRGPLRELAGDVLSPARVSAAGWWHPPAVQELLEAHWAGRANHARVLWALLIAELWRAQVWSAPASVVEVAA